MGLAAANSLTVMLFRLERARTVLTKAREHP